MQRGDMLIIALCLIACAALIYAIDWAAMYETLLLSINAQVYGHEAIK
jgi:hypothetical protein